MEILDELPAVYGVLVGRIRNDLRMIDLRIGPDSTMEELRYLRTQYEQAHGTVQLIRADLIDYHNRRTGEIALLNGRIGTIELSVDQVLEQSILLLTNVGVRLHERDQCDPRVLATETIESRYGRTRDQYNEELSRVRNALALGETQSGATVLLSTICSFCDGAELDLSSFELQAFCFIFYPFVFELEDFVSSGFE